MAIEEEMTDWQVSLSKAPLPTPEVRPSLWDTLPGLDLLLRVQELVVRARVEAAQHGKGTKANWWPWERSGCVCTHGTRKHQQQGLFQTQEGTYLSRAVGNGVISLRISIHHQMPFIIRGFKMSSSHFEVPLELGRVGTHLKGYFICYYSLQYHPASLVVCFLALLWIITKASNC